MPYDVMRFHPFLYYLCYDILRLPQQDQGPLEDVISTWLDFEEIREEDQDSGDIDDTGTYEQAILKSYNTNTIK